MPATKTKTKTRPASEAKFKLPRKVYNANWRDDIPEEADLEALDYESFPNEAEYVSPTKVSREASERILRRAKSMQVGQRLLSILKEAS